MNQEQAQRELIRLWLNKADDALASAEVELKQKHFNFAINRLYYASFYAVTALLLKDGKQFSRHSAVKSEFVKTYIKSGPIDKKWNAFYQKLFDDRQQGDYIPTVTFDERDISSRLEEVVEFVAVIKDNI